MAIVVVHSAEEWIARFGEGRKRTAVTIGNFDGVHRGHQEILRRVHTLAAQENLMSGVLTFYPHPAKVLRPEHAPALLLTIDQRLKAIEGSGIDAALVMRFDEALAKLSPEDFVEHFLVNAMRSREVLVGENFRFGHKQAGDVRLLSELGKKWHFHVEVLAPVKEGAVVASSTAIRAALHEGRVEDARELLGRPYALTGEIKTGTGQGRKFVVPTLNLSTEQELLPKSGVYATEAVVGGKTYRAATNVGNRPTFDGSHTTIESHLFDFNEMLTSGPLEVRFFKRLRDERKFSGPAELREQILRDIEQAKDYFRNTAVK
jgi:riboflavin kinase / FMN adenylyltransferase